MAKNRELPMAQARHNLDWEKQFKQAMFGELARQIHDRDGKLETCSMCGDLCAIKLVKEIFEKDSQKDEKG
jgi:phosphomethylpyrimidine synthase